MQVELPRLLGTRKAARDTVEQAELPPDLNDHSVIVLANRVASVSASYADELVKQLLEDRNAEEILLVGASPHLEERLNDAVARRHVKGTVRRTTASEAGV